MTAQETKQNLAPGYERLLAHKAHHARILWMHAANFFLGLFLITNPITFGYGNTMSGRSDIFCGIIISSFSLLSINPMRLWAPWITAIAGLWLNVAPLLFWSEEAVIYNTDSLAGILVITFSIVAPGIPGARLIELPGPDTPPGWSVNPSSWTQRIPIITIGWIGFFASRYLAGYQLGYTSEIADLVFGKGTENVLNSDVSKAWPVSDAGLGAFSYMLDAMMGYLGGVNRWRTMPWVVLLFGILVIPLGAVSIGLIILQPIAVGSWCSVCLFTAAAMLIMIPCTFDEVFASIWFLRERKKAGHAFWKTLFLGGELEEKNESSYDASPITIRSTINEIFSGLRIPWNLFVLCVTGVWLMCSPAVLNYEGAMADSDHVLGALVITFSVIAIGEVVRVVRFINILLGIWIVMLPFLIEGPSKKAFYNAVICGLFIIILSFRKGKTINNYGTFNKYIF